MKTELIRAHQSADQLPAPPASMPQEPAGDRRRGGDGETLESALAIAKELCNCVGQLAKVGRAGT